MDNLYFKDIDDTNENIVKKIKLKKGQEKFIETVDECLQDFRNYKGWHPVAVYYDEVIIGFAMYGSFGPNRDTWIDRIMIDEKYQGQGFGRIAMIKLIDIVSKEYDVSSLYLSFFEDNIVSYNLYTSLGFKYIGEKDVNGELIYQVMIG